MRSLNFFQTWVLIVRSSVFMLGRKCLWKIVVFGSAEMTNSNYTSARDTTVYNAGTRDLSTVIWLGNTLRLSTAARSYAF